MPKAETCAYIRMSDDKQTNSVDRQRQEAISTALRWKLGIVGKFFVDEGVTGQTAARVAFQEMIDACKQGKFNTVIIAEQSRLSRLDSWDAPAEYFIAFRDLGVRVFDPFYELDFNTNEGRMMINMRQDMAHAESKKTSDRVKSGRRSKARNGQWLGGTPPLGFVVDQETRLLVHDLPERVEAVRFAFNAIANGETQSSVCRVLRSQWGIDRTLTGLKRMLARPEYIGDRADGKTTQALFDTAGKRRGKNARGPTAKVARKDWVIVRQCHPGIVKRPLFDRVQSQLTRKAGSNRRKANSSRNRDYIFSGGLLRCGFCGHTMAGTPRRTPKQRIKYNCRHYSLKGEPCDGGHNRVDQNILIQNVVIALEDQLFTESGMKRLRGECADKVKEDKAEAKQAGRELRQVTLELERTERRFTEKFDSMPDSAVNLIMEKIERLKKEKEALELSIAERKPISKVEMERSISAGLKQLRRVIKKAETDDPEAVRQILNLYVESVSVWMRKKPSKTTLIAGFISGTKKAANMTNKEVAKAVGNGVSCQDVATYRYRVRQGEEPQGQTTYEIDRGEITLKKQAFTAQQVSTEADRSSHVMRLTWSGDLTTAIAS